MTDTDQLPKDAKVDLKDVKIYLADTATTGASSSSKTNDQSSGITSAVSSDKTDDQLGSKTRKIDAKTMTKKELATLTYTKDVTADFTVKFKNGKLTVTPKADKAVEYASKQTKTCFVASLLSDKVDSELTKQSHTYTWNNKASNGKDDTSTVKSHTDKPATSAKPTTPVPKSTVTKVVKMA